MKMAFFSESNGKAFGFQLLKGFELLIWIDTQFESRISPSLHGGTTSKGANILYKNKKKKSYF